MQLEVRVLTKELHSIRECSFKIKLCVLGMELPLAFKQARWNIAPVLMVSQVLKLLRKMAQALLKYL